MQALWMIYHDIGQINCRLEVTHRDILNNKSFLFSQEVF